MIVGPEDVDLVGIGERDQAIPPGQLGCSLA